MNIGYARISTDGQTHAAQIDALKAAGCDKIFTETASGAKKDRPVLAEALAYLRPNADDRPIKVGVHVGPIERCGHTSHQFVSLVPFASFGLS